MRVTVSKITILAPTTNNTSMKRLLTIAVAALAIACSTPQPQEFHVIPMPESVTINEGSFNVKGAAFNVADNLDELSVKAIQRFQQALETATGKKCRKADKGFSFSLNPNLGAEEYAINIDKEGVKVEAAALNGFVYACETLKQMLPPAIYGGKKADADWALPYVSIFDGPRFEYRGMHLDACRHFWSIEVLLVVGAKIVIFDTVTRILGQKCRCS